MNQYFIIINFHLKALLGKLNGGDCSANSHQISSEDTDSWKNIS